MTRSQLLLVCSTHPCGTGLHFFSWKTFSDLGMAVSLADLFLEDSH
jgi:hypothetical protein